MKRIIGWAVFIVIVLLGVLFLHPEILFRPSPDVLRENETRNRMGWLADYIVESDLRPEDVPTDQLVESLRLVERGAGEHVRGIDARAGVVRDAWGNPIILQKLSWEPFGFVLVSYGANGRDDGGSGDDIVLDIGRPHGTER